MIALIMLDFPVEYPAYEDMIEGRHFYPLSYRYDNGKCIGGPHYTLLIRFLTRSGDTLPYTQRWLNFISAGAGQGYPNSYCVYKHPEEKGMQCIQSSISAADTVFPDAGVLSIVKMQNL